MTTQPFIAILNRSTRRNWTASNRRYDRFSRSLVSGIEDLMEPSLLMNWKTLL